MNKSGVLAKYVLTIDEWVDHERVSYGQNSTVRYLTAQEYQDVMRILGNAPAAIDAALTDAKDKP